MKVVRQLRAGVIITNAIIKKVNLYTGTSYIKPENSTYRSRGLYCYFKYTIITF